MKEIPRLNKIRDKERVYYNPNQNEKNEYIKIKNELQNKYGVSTSNRDLIIKQLISTLTHGDYNNYTVEDINLFIIRSDIKNFYPSVNKHRLYKKLMNSNMLSDSTLKILKPMFFSSSISGIPLGLPFSSVLAEIYLEEFDVDIYQKFNPTFYFRYVDDVIIINYDTLEGIDSNVANQKLETIFDRSFLEINLSKTNFYHYRPLKKQKYKELSFDYLGYNFETKNGKLIISITKNKYTKILNRIKYYFYLLKKGNKSEKQFWLLYYRLMNSLYGIKSLDANKKQMYFGLGYSYRFINNEIQIDHLISEIKGLIHSCNLNSKRTSALFYLIYIDNYSLDLLAKRYDYTRLTVNQINKVKSRLQLTNSSTTISKLFYNIYRGI